MTKSFSVVSKILCAGIILLALTSCAGMDARVDILPTSNLYGTVPPRVSSDKCKYTMKDNAPDPSTYTVLAQYVVQEAPTVILGLSAQEMICHAYVKAVEKGADAIIVDEIGTTNVAGGAARTSPVVKVRSIRFKGELPPDMK